MQNFTELYEVERRYEELAHKMSTPDAAADAELVGLRLAQPLLPFHARCGGQRRRVRADDA